MSAEKLLRSAIQHAAISYLARREHSRHELQQKLKRKFPDETEVIASVLSHLAERNLQSELRFAENYTRHRANAGFGLQRIRMELKQRGIDANILEQALPETNVDWEALAQQVYQKKYGSKPAEDLKEKRKRQRFMVSRGFGFSCC